MKKTKNSVLKSRYFTSGILGSIGDISGSHRVHNHMP